MDVLLNNTCADINHKCTMKKNENAFEQSK